MVRFIILSFAFMAWAFYELSGGADFEPRRPVAMVDPETPSGTATAPVDTVTKAAFLTDETAPAPEVTRVSVNLTTVAAARPAPAVPQPAATEPVAPENGADAALPVAGDTSMEGLATALRGTLDGSAPAAEAVTAATLVTATDAADSAAPADIRAVTASRVNLRQGPGTGFGIHSKLSRGQRVEVLEDNGDGWVRVRPDGSDEIAWLAAFLLSEPVN